MWWIAFSWSLGQWIFDSQGVPLSSFISLEVPENSPWIIHFMGLQLLIVILISIIADDAYIADDAVNSRSLMMFIAFSTLLVWKSPVSPLANIAFPHECPKSPWIRKDRPNPVRLEGVKNWMDMWTRTSFNVLVGEPTRWMGSSLTHAVDVLLYLLSSVAIRNWGFLMSGRERFPWVIDWKHE